ncbi:MAG TPA: hypothetical protein VGE37_12775 [Archangium sp.]
MKLTPFLDRRARAIAIIAAAEKPLAEITLPGIRIRGTTNGSQGVTLAGRRGRRAKQRGLHGLGRTAATMLRLKKLTTAPLVVRIVRVAPNRLDGDNLEASLKRVRDGIAKTIGIDDRSPAVEYVPDDERGAVREYALRFEVYAQPEPQASFAAEWCREHKQCRGALRCQRPNASKSRQPTPNLVAPRK